MQPSSLIFVAVVAIWAAFLVQHWVRRREAMAIARSVDRFSDAMRLLERRPAPAPAAPRPSRSEIAAAPLPSRRPSQVSPLVARGGAREVARLAPKRPMADAHPTRAGSHGRAGRRLRTLIRAVALLVVLASVPGSLVAWALGALPWWSVLASVGAFAVVVLSLRYAAVRARTRRRLDRSIAASLRATQSSRTVTRTDAASGALGTERDSRSATTGAGASSEPGDGESSGALGRGSSRGERAAYRAGVSGPTWSPVPVPPPTYTLKERAYRPEPAPEPVEPPAAAPSVLPSVQLPQEPARRVVG